MFLVVDETCVRHFDYERNNVHKLHGQKLCLTTMAVERMGSFRLRNLLLNITKSYRRKLAYPVINVFVTYAVCELRAENGKFYSCDGHSNDGVYAISLATAIKTVHIHLVV